MILLQIDWNPSPEIFKIGSIAIRYYSLMFVIAFVLGLYLMKKIYVNDKIPIEKLDSLFIYTILSMFIGMRLGEVLFYSWDYYQHHLLEIILPIKRDPNSTFLWIFKGYEFTGFRGLASHGAAIGIIIGLYIYSKKILHKPLLWILDRVGIVVALGGFWIRTGNLMNSEIIGKPTNSNYGFVFRRLGEDFPRHPTQIYEALSYLAIFFVLWYLYWKTNIKERLGVLFGLFFALLWAVRFVIEFFKEAQVDERAQWVLNTGQWLSIPLIVAGLFFMYRKRTS